MLPKLSKGQLITGGLAAVGSLIEFFGGDNPFGAGGPEYVWKFKEYDSIYSDKNVDTCTRKYGYGPAPELHGMTAAQTGGAPLNTVDVVDKFKWTQTPMSGRHDVPTLILKEKKILQNPQINQIAHNLYTVAQKGTRGAAQLKAMLPDELKSKLNSQNIKAENELGSAIMNAFNETKGAVKQFSAGSGVLSPYEDMYKTKDTGFLYHLPYMEQKWKDISNQFGGGEGTSGLEKIRGLSEKVTKLVQNVNIMNPGTYVEQPKLYNFGGRRTNSYTVSFPLLNTGSFNDVIKNWQFIFLMVYQNTPNRLTRDLVDPPCIYEASIPGTWYSKYAYISNMSVDFLGATREMKLPIPSEVTSDGSGQNKLNYLDVRTVVPDVYQVSITVEEMFSETQNMLFHSVNEDNSIVTTRGSSNSPLGNVANKLTNNITGAIKSKFGL